MWNNWSHISQTQQMVWPLWRVVQQFIKLTVQSPFGNLIPKKFSLKKKMSIHRLAQGTGSLVVKRSTHCTSACIQLEFLPTASDSTFLLEAMTTAQVVGFLPPRQTPGLGFTLQGLSQDIGSILGYSQRTRVFSLSSPPPK